MLFGSPWHGNSRGSCTKLLDMSDALDRRGGQQRPWIILEDACDSHESVAILVRWKCGLFATRVCEASHPGRSDVFGSSSPGPRSYTHVALQADSLAKADRDIRHSFCRLVGSLCQTKTGDWPALVLATEASELAAHRNTPPHTFQAWPSVKSSARLRRVRRQRRSPAL